ncbi:MAG: lysostaphin resistance A-like protein [Nitriliruptorales bacterium]
MPWTIWDGIGLILWSVLAQTIVALPLLAAGIDPSQGLTTFIVLIAAQALTFVGIVGWLRARGGLSWRLFGPLRPAWSHVWIGVVIGLSGFVIVTLIVLITAAAFGPLQPPEQIVLERLTESPAAMTLGFVAAVLLAPIVEELIFRAVLFQAFRQRMGLWPAVGFSSFIFGLSHVELYPVPFFVVVLAIFGFLLAAAFHHAGSLVVPILAHAVFNGVELSVALLVLPR